MQINKVAFIGKGGVGLLYGSMIAQALGNDAVEYVMDDARFERHAGDALTVNGKLCALKSVRASEATPVDLVILTVKTTGLDQALKTMERIVGPDTLIASLCNGITSEQKIAERFGWEHTVLGICQAWTLCFSTARSPLPMRARSALVRPPAPTPRPSPLSTGSTRAAASPIPSSTTSHIACGPNSCSTTASTRPVWPTAAPTEALRSRLRAAPQFCLRHARDACSRQCEGIELTEEDLTQMVRLIKGLDPAGMPSMAQDRIAQRRTEVEEFAGTICRLAAKHGIQVPQNEWLYSRIREIEASW